MYKNHINLIKYLLSENSIKSSSNIALKLGVSVRSVKNYVKEINDSHHTKVILSSKHGYFVNKDEALDILSESQSNIPQNYEERAYYIIKLLLLNHVDKIDLYELCDLLYISYSTLKADINNMNKTFSNFNVKFICENDSLIIDGSEKSKRKLVSHIIYEEVSSNFLDINYIKENFKNLDVNKIKYIVETIFKDHNYYINDINLFNLTLHYTIIINRLKEGNCISSNKTFKIENMDDCSLIHDLTAEFENEFSISFNHNEQYELYVLFKNNTNSIVSTTMEDLNKLVDINIISFIKDLIARINEEYYINLLNDSFIIPFSLHLKNLFSRATNSTFAKNPMLNIIKTSSPMIYEIAIYAALLIEKKFKFIIEEDEIAYIALHIGAELERQKANEGKISCVLLCPNYMEISSLLYNKLLFQFGNNINIINTVSDLNMIKSLDFSLLITTVNIKSTLKHETVYISPFLSVIDKSAIFNTIEEIKANQMNIILKDNFRRFFDKNILFINPEITNKEKAIALMANKLISLGYVNDDFQNKILERERAASTAFSNIAIPHSVEMNAIKTSIAVIVSKNGIQWNDRTVNLVIMVAINKADKRVFHDLYQALIALFSKSEIMDLIKDVKDFNNFENLIYSSI